MNRELQLKLQAWVDGELSAEESRQVEQSVQGDAQGAALAAELRLTRSFLAGNEREIAVPESREFYWSQIQRRIETQEKAGLRTASAQGISFWSAMRRFIAPASGFALVLFLGLASIKFFGPGALDESTLQMVEVENLSEEMGSIAYRSQADNMFVVYLYSKDRQTPPVESESVDDLLFQ